VTRVKVCGIMDERELNCAILGGADAVGFIVDVERSRHRISVEDASNLIRRVPVFTKSVAVIAPDSMEGAVVLAQGTGADILQVHGTLGADEIKALKKRVPQKVVASVPPSMDVHSMDGVADAILLDTFKDGKLGGTGVVHDWSLSAILAKELRVPVILAGGLNPSNVGEAIRTVRPYAVDVSSGVETDGIKDLKKIKLFIREVRSCLQPKARN
jgi:phosphoribosylanthranilate isomerase